jgi:hypothetical protein
MRRTTKTKRRRKKKTKRKGNPKRPKRKKNPLKRNLLLQKANAIAPPALHLLRPRKKDRDAISREILTAKVKKSTMSLVDNSTVEPILKNVSILNQLQEQPAIENRNDKNLNKLLSYYPPSVLRWRIFFIMVKYFIFCEQQ